MLDKIAARTARAAAVIGFPEPGRDLHNAAAVCANGRVLRRVPQAAAAELRGVRRAALLRRAARAAAAVRRRRREGRRLDLRGRVEPDGPDPHRGRGRRGARSSTSTRRRTTRSASSSARRCSRRVPPTRRCRSSTRTSSAVRTSSCSTARRSCSTSRASSSPAPSSSSTDLLVVDVDVRPAFRKRQLDPRGRVDALPLPEIPVSEPRPPDARVAARIEPTLAPVHEVYEALVLGTRDYVRKNGFTDVADRAVGRHRLRARRRDRGRRARRRARGGRADAVAVLERPQHLRRRGARREPRDPVVHGPDRARARRVRGDARRRCSRAPMPGSPRRTCRPASAATC